MMSPGTVSSFAKLRSLTQRPDAAEKCGFCKERIPAIHEHLLEPQSRRVICVCTSCSCLFTASDITKYRRVPQQVTSLGDFSITDAEWDDMAIPIGMAFFFKRSEDGGAAAIYPSPAGPVESQLPLTAWDRIAARSAAIERMEPLVQGVLANRAAGDYLLSPIDECYRLTGLIRVHWRGLSGGSAVWAEIRSFFDEMRKRASPEEANA